MYSDEDKIDPAGHYVAPFFKPDWSPDLLRTVNYICHVVGVRRTIYDDVGGLRTGYEGAQDYDFVLRATAASRRVADVARVSTTCASTLAQQLRTFVEARSSLSRASRAGEVRSSSSARCLIEPGADLTTHRVR